MKFIRNFLKKIIMEAILENFPPMHISIQAKEGEFKKLMLKNCIFKGSKVRISPMEVDINGCEINTDGASPFISNEMEDKEDVR